MATRCTTAVPVGCAPGDVSARVLDDFTRRFNAATADALVPQAGQPTNGDIDLPDKCGTYSKAILQDSPGKVNFPAFATFYNACQTGKFSDYEAVPIGGTQKFNGPMASYAYPFVGADNSLFGAPQVPAAPGLSSPEYATELIELYWCSLLRDVPFREYPTNPTAIEAAKELSSLSAYAGPKTGGSVTPELLFRSVFAGELAGPYVSQFLVTPTSFGAAPFDQRYVTYEAGVDYMTDLDSWFAVQQGKATGFTNSKDGVPRYLHNGRGLAAYTHVDELYQAYFTAYLVVNAMAGANPWVINPGSPYVGSRTQKPFGTFGGPDIAAVLAQVAKYALTVVWWQKWVVHLRHRPEAGAGLVHLIKHGETFSASPDPLVFHSKALEASHKRYKTFLLSQPFPEGSPTHPAYPTGHGAVGGACITVLKFFFNGDFVLPNPVMPNFDGTALESWTGQPGTGAPGPLTVNGELNKLAENITFGHGLHGGIHWRSDSDASMRLGEAAALSFLQDLACSYAEPFSVTLTLLDGSSATISNL